MEEKTKVTGWTYFRWVISWTILPLEWFCAITWTAGGYIADKLDDLRMTIGAFGERVEKKRNRWIFHATFQPPPPPPCFACNGTGETPGFKGGNQPCHYGCPKPEILPESPSEEA